MTASSDDRAVAESGDDEMLLPLRPVPDPRARPWGGSRFTGVAPTATDGAPVGELWVAGPGSVVVDPRGGHDHVGQATPGITTPAGPGSHADVGRPTLSLDDLAAREGERLVGRVGMELLGPRFPLLVKLIDPAEWLSLQIHPDDEQARAIGDGSSLGKREAWYVIAADAEARIVVGAAAGVDRPDLMAAVERGHVPFELLETIEAVPGSLIDVPPRTLHAIGPGAFLYEIQQPSDLTLRASDWGRPSRPDRPLHIDETLRLVDVASHAEVLSHDDDGHAVLTTDRFRLEVVVAEVELRPGGRSVEVITVVDGSALVEGDGWLEALETFQTLVVPASVPRYRIRPGPGARVCVGSLP